MDSHTIAVIGVAVFSLVLGIIGWLVRQLMASQLREIERRQSNTEAHAKKGDEEKAALNDRLRLDEIATERLNGRLALTEQARATLERDVARMQEDHVPRAEWERAMSTLTNSIEKLAQKIDRLPSSSGRYQQYPSPPPMSDDRKR